MEKAFGLAEIPEKGEEHLMANQQQLVVLEQGTLHWNEWRKANPQAKIDLTKANLHGKNLTGADLHAADLSGAKLSNADLTEANLERSYLGEADLQATTLIRARLVGANFTHANLEQSDLSDADLHDAKLVQANLNRTKFSRTNLRDADLTHASIRDADFSYADVGGADLHRVHPSDQTVWPPLPQAAVLQYLYLLRVPILMGITLFALPILSLTSFSSLLGNLFVLDLWNIFWTMIATVALAFSILVTFRTVLLNGMQRFGVQQALTRDKVSVPNLLLSEALTLPMLVLIVYSNGQAPDAKTFLTRLAVGLAGMVVAHLGAYFVLLVAVLLSQRYRIPADQRYPLPFLWMRKLLVRAENFNVVSADWRNALGNWGKGGSHAFRAGYFDPNTGLLYPGHWLSFVSLGATFVLYQFIGHLKHAHLGQAFGIPAICFVVLLLMLLTWILAMAAFFLDRYRIPLLLLMVLLIWIGNKTPQSDHYYQTKKGNPIPVSPERVLAAVNRLAPDAAHPRGRVVLVATEGGGIQAAAWTAQVLTGLQKEVHGISKDKPINFADSIALISSVSGGAVGTMFFVNGYRNTSGAQGFNVPDSDLPEIVDQAEEPALDDIAWALAYPDFWRVFFPYTKAEKDKLVDRGLALEERWSKRGNIRTSLNDWRQGVEEGWRPAVIFNSTFVETGEPFLLTTTDMPKTPGNGPQRKTFSDLAPQSDIQLVTAVRLASTFPFVTPASRDLSDDRPYHVVDGGYYDNYGVYSLLAWLRQALTATPQQNRPDVLIIQIRSFPPDPAVKGKSEGWFYQAYAPLQALLSVRTTAQLVRDGDALAVFIDEWQSKGARVCQATFEFDRTHAPLSWQLNAAQKKNIMDDWNQKKTGPEWSKVSSFFRGVGDKDCM